MKMWRLAIGDIRFQWKYGFYILYAIFTVVYLLTLVAIPEGARRTVATVMIYTDPAAMGLFFMGAIILLEKSQRVHLALAVSPIKVADYMFAKLISLALIGLIVGTVLALTGGITQLPICLSAILLSSFICSACGLIAANRSRSLNHFVLLAVPFEMFLCLPPILLLFGYSNPWLTIHPGIAAIWLIYGDAPSVLLSLLSLIVWCIVALLFCRRSIARYFQQTGGKSE